MLGHKIRNRPNLPFGTAVWSNGSNVGYSLGSWDFLLFHGKTKQFCDLSHVVVVDLVVTQAAQLRMHSGMRMLGKRHRLRTAWLLLKFVLKI